MQLITVYSPRDGEPFELRPALAEKLISTAGWTREPPAAAEPMHEERQHD